MASQYRRLPVVIGRCNVWLAIRKSLAKHRLVVTGGDAVGNWDHSADGSKRTRQGRGTPCRLVSLKCAKPMLARGYASQCCGYLELLTGQENLLW